jgi:jumonji domain-containing protein 7
MLRRVRYPSLPFEMNHDIES